MPKADAVRSLFSGIAGRCDKACPVLKAAARDSFGEVVLVVRLREAIRRLTPAIPEEAWATVRPYRRVQIERRPNP